MKPDAYSVLSDFFPEYLTQESNNAKFATKIY